MKIFQDMSEIPLCPMDDLSLSNAPSDSNPSSSQLEFESSTEFSFLSKLSPMQNSNPLACTYSKDQYAPLQSPLPLLCSWPPRELCQPILDETTEAKTKKAPRSKGIRKADSERKKNIKQMRNRISAQRSRDRKKKELEDLRDEADKLKLENDSLKGQLEAATKELEQFRRIMAQGKAAEAEQKKHARRSLKRKANSHFLLATLVIGCLCAAACICPIVGKMDGGATLSTSPPKAAAISAVPNKESQLTPLQKARREFIERHSRSTQEEMQKLEKEAISKNEIIARSESLIAMSNEEVSIITAGRMELNGVMKQQAFV